MQSFYMQTMKTRIRLRGCAMDAHTYLSFPWVHVKRYLFPIEAHMFCLQVPYVIYNVYELHHTKKSFSDICEY